MKMDAKYQSVTKARKIALNTRKFGAGANCGFQTSTAVDRTFCNCFLTDQIDPHFLRTARLVSHTSVSFSCFCLKSVSRPETARLQHSGVTDCCSCPLVFFPFVVEAAFRFTCRASNGVFQTDLRCVASVAVSSHGTSDG